MVNTPIPCSLKSEAKKAAKILKEFSFPSSKNGPDKIIPSMWINPVEVQLLKVKIIHNHKKSHLFADIGIEKEVQHCFL